MADHGWFILQKSVDDQFYFTLEAENDQTIAVSEMYTTRQAAENGIAAVRRVAHGAHTIDIAK